MGFIRTTGYLLSGPSNRSVRKRRKLNKKINKNIEANIKHQKRMRKQERREDAPIGKPRQLGRVSDAELRRRFADRALVNPFNKLEGEDLRRMQGIYQEHIDGLS